MRSLIGYVPELFSSMIRFSTTSPLAKKMQRRRKWKERLILLMHEFIVATEHGYQTNIGDRYGNYRRSTSTHQHCTTILKDPKFSSRRATSALIRRRKLVQEALIDWYKIVPPLPLLIDYPPLRMPTKFMFIRWRNSRTWSPWVCKKWILSKTMRRTIDVTDKCI